MDIHIQSHDTGVVPGADKMTRAQAEVVYDFIGFSAPFVAVRRKADNVVGTLEFTHQPRLYFGFQANS